MIVLDTHVIVRDALQPQSLSTRARTAIAEADADEGCILCDISLWEIAMLMHLGRLAVDAPYQEFARLLLQARRCTVQAITPEIAELSTTLPDEVGADPADRLIAATSIHLDVPLVTADSRLRGARCVRTIW